MPALSPIATLALLSGSAGVLELYASPTPYDPSSASDYAAPAPTTLAVKGVFSTAKIAGIEVTHDAVYLIDINTVPAGLLPEKSHCTVNGQRYLVMSAGDRWYLGRRDGLALHLQTDG